MSDPVDKSLRASGSQHGPRPHRQGSRGAGIPGLEELKPREFRSRADELKYFMVSTSCLQCRKTVQAPVDKLHYKLRCPHCGMLMHLRQDGKWYPGIHPSLEGEESRKGWRGRAGEWWNGLTQSGRRGVVAGSVAVLTVMLVFIGLSLLGPSQSHLPEKIEDRAGIVAQSLVTGNASTWQGMVADGTAREAGKWFEQVHERVRNRQPASAPVRAIELQVLFVNWNERRGAISVQLRMDGGDVSCVTMWLLDADDQWMLDGRQTLDDLQVGTAPGVTGKPDDEEL